MEVRRAALEFLEAIERFYSLYVSAVLFFVLISHCILNVSLNETNRSNGRDGKLTFCLFLSCNLYTEAAAAA